MWIKVCGIRDCQTACQLADLEIDAIGLNFFSRSPRFVPADEAKSISRILPPTIARVGVFVNQAISDVEWTASECGLSMVQLHGDESSSYFSELHRRLPNVRLVRAWRMSESGLGGLGVFLDECSREQVELFGCLVDAHVAGLFGGSGKTVDWDRLNQQYERDHWPPLILAGGLTVTNIAQAIRSTAPWGVDVASGVEASPGVKNLDLVRQFVANARKF